MISEDRATILVVDDQPALRATLGTYLEHSGFRVLTAADGSQARLATIQNEIDLILLDIVMPDEDGMSLCRALRGMCTTPVIFLSARDQDNDRIAGLEVGADDYIVKPFNPRELIARIKAILRRRHAAPPEAIPTDSGSIRFDHWYLQRRKKRLISLCGEHEHELTSAEYELLMVFLRHPRRVLARDELLEMTCGRKGRPFDRTIDNQVRRLRKKVEAEPSRPNVIRTVWGRGYCLDVEVDRQTR
ncbi:response regulator [Halofilum ochraceum]|uniref:response regulator n=1 Tax=Halofilum ochraceum TaxID=1611323 RepID=UPI00082C77F5|nr:response regulator [Halofilum ochraceum]